MTAPNPEQSGKTIAVPFCNPSCPPIVEWPDKNLALGVCPKCSRANGNGWRMAVARRLIAEREEWGRP